MSVSTQKYGPQISLAGEKTNDLDRPPTTVAKLPGQNPTAVSFPNTQSQDKSLRVGFRDIRGLSPHKFRMDICGPFLAKHDVHL